MRKKFSFIFPIMHPQKDSQRSSGIKYDHVADLLIAGVATKENHIVLDNITNRSSFNIESVLFNGQEVVSLLHAFGSMEQINDACSNHVEDIFSDNNLTPDPIKMNPYSARIISLPLRRRIN